MISLALALFMGVLYGLIVGIIPAAGATTGLVVLFPLVSFIVSMGEPYLAVVFLMAVVAASTTGDTFSSVLLGIPGANSSAATIVDGYPLTQRGEASYALSAAITSSTINGVIWGILTFAFLPWYGNVMLFLGIPELWALTLLALMTVVFVSNQWWVRGLIALSVGIFVGLIGTDPITNGDRYTFGWDYLIDGVQLMPVVAGLFAIPEIIEALWKRGFTYTPANTTRGDTLRGIKDTMRHWIASIRGGVCGAFIGLLPGLGGAIADWLAYSQTVANTKNPNPKFGEGNIIGVIGAEGANNAQKATSMVPTVLFGIPGAPFAAVLLALFSFLGFELGSISLLYDDQFFSSLFIGFMVATVVTAVICYAIIPYAGKISEIPYIYYAPFVLGLVIWSCMTYTGGWEDFAMLVIFSVIGLSAKYFKFNRIALLIGFLLSSRIESLTIQLFDIYTPEMLLNSSVFIVIILLMLGVVTWGMLFNRNKVNFV